MLTAGINPQIAFCVAGKCFGLHCCGIKLWLIFYICCAVIRQELLQAATIRLQFFVSSIVRPVSS